jgi:large subunit ribosomal protein L35
MPKLKTNRIAAKKFSVSKNGKIKHAKAFRRHHTGKKSAKRKRHLSAPGSVAKTDVKAVRKLLPYA